MKAVDLFCGCGGISAGIEMAGYEVVAGVDVDKHYIATFKHNFPNASAITKSITEIPPQEFAHMVGLEPGELDLLVGGPPCQGFSKNVPRRHRFLEDPKNLLVKSFLDYAEFLKPRVILMENVAEMKNGFEGQYTEEVTGRLEAAGYTVTHGVLNAADYGVPQRRRRAFFMANRVGCKFSIPLPTHIPKPKMPMLVRAPTHVSVWEAIGDLPPLKHGEGEEVTPYEKVAASEYQQRVRNPEGVVRNHKSQRLQPTQHERLSSLQPGQGHKDLPAHLQVKSGYSGAYGRLTKDMIAPTITRWVFHAGSGRFSHPVDIRVLTMREVARIQGFLDRYEFVGTNNQQAGQLGNAVPPLLAHLVVRDLDAQLERYSASKSSVKRSNDTLSPSEGNAKRIA